MPASQLLNPYTVGGALDGAPGSGFYGREDVFAFVRRALSVVRRAPIILYGQRRIGKSSVLRQLPRHVPEGSVCVFYDLQFKSGLSLDGLLFGLARDIADACGVPRPTRDDIRAETFEAHLVRCTAALEAPERLVLLFDEFDVADVNRAQPGGANGFMRYLAELIERQPRIGYVMVVGRKTSELSAELAGAILRSAMHFRIGRLAPETASALARELGRDTLHFTEEGLARVVHHAAGQPYCTQLLCHVIWNRLVADRGKPLPVTVQAADVDAAVPDAVDFGTLALNWAYEGLEAPSHKLFLGALAELTRDDGGYVPLASIEQRLVRVGATLDAAELRGAPGHLANWDVLDSSPQGHRFSVPMIGQWVRTYRPLSELEQQTRLVNPRAWRHFELAMESQHREAWSEAIENYRLALQANPALVEAYLGMAACLRARDLEGDLDSAIETYERALALDPEAPRQALLDALCTALQEQGDSVDMLARHYKRVTQLDSGAYAERARRTLAEMARLRVPLLSGQLNEARALFELIDDKEGMQTVDAERLARRPAERINNIGVAVFWLLLLLAFVPLDTLPFVGITWLSTERSDTVRHILVTLSMASFGLMLSVNQHSTSRSRLLVFAATLAVGTAASLLGWGLVLTGFASFIGCAIMAAWLSPPTPPVPPQLRPPPKAKAGPEPAGGPLASLARRAAAALLKFAERPKEEKKP
jgi:tetratricopeptide (TPR) repeat protein